LALHDALPIFEVSVPWQMTRAVGRGGRGTPGPVSGAAGVSVPAPQGTSPGNPSASSSAGQSGASGASGASGERLGSQCGQPQMQALASPQGNKILYVKVLEGAECYQTSFTGFSADAKDNDIRIENKRTGAGVRVTGDRPLARF